MSKPNKIQVFITTAKPLATNQRSLLRQLIGKKLGSDFVIKEELDQNSLGGIKIKIGSQEYDTTITGKLKKLQSQTPIVAVATADGLSQDQKIKLQKTLEKKMGGSFIIEETVDKSLIGGLRLLVNDKEYDGTIKNQLNKIHQQIKKSL